MSSITIVSGCPGSGKTTLARTLAERSDEGLHLVSDDFYRYPGRPIAPTEPESKHQNETILRAVARAANAFRDGGYDVYVDGVIGPWMLPVICAELPDSESLAYVVLRADLGLALSRVREREGAGASAAVEQMHRALSELGDLAGCELETSGRSPAEVQREFDRRAACGELLLRSRGRSR
jgi:cytidylate kinase